jgi:putative heme-binding domain-containing protein
MLKTNLLLVPGTGLWLALALLMSSSVRAQHSYTPAQIDEGRRLYDNNCGRCHGDAGDGVAGVELFKQIRRASSDEDIAKIIKQGISGTAMPAHNFTDAQALNVVAYLRSMVGAAPAPRANAAAAAAAAGTATISLAGGDPVRGKAIFTGKGGCSACHRAEGSGGQTGPDLSAIGRVRPPRGFDPGGPNVPQIERSILDPNAEIAPQYRVFQVTPKSGAAVRGTLLNQDTFSIQMLDSTQHLRAFLKSDLKDYGFQPSPMPVYQGKLTTEEMADLLTYLLSLKG